MNLAGKIITALILILSVCYMMIGIMVNASHQNWKALAEENKRLVEELRQNRALILAQTTEKNVVIEKEKVARAARIRYLESELQLAREAYDQAIEQLAAQRIKAQEAFTVVENSERRIAEQDQTIGQLQSQLQTLTVNVSDLQGDVVEKTKQIFELERIKQGLEKTRMDLAAQTAEQSRVLTANGLSETSLTDSIPRELEGAVTSVQGDSITVNLGKDDGLREGHQFDIFRSGRFIGTAKVTTARNSQSVARLDRALTKFAVQARDSITTRYVVRDIRGR